MTQIGLDTQILLRNALQYIQTKEFDIAWALLQKALIRSPNNPEILRILSVVSALKFDFTSALELIDRVISLAPDNGVAHSNRGNILKELHRYEEALESFDNAIALLPNYAEAYSNKGNALQELQHYEEALHWYDRAIALQPDYAEAYSNKGNALEWLRRHEQAMENFDRSISINPQYIDAYWHKALSQLASGNYQFGWQNYEARWSKLHPIKFQHSGIPRLQGLDNVADKNILIWAEQGLGDTLQFCRYIQPLADLGANITFVVPKALLNILSSLKSYCKIITQEDGKLGNFDFQSPLLSLPLLFGTSVDTIPGTPSYLRVDLEKKNIFAPHVVKGKNLKVGLVWNGGFRVDHPELWEINKRRNIELELIAELRDIPEIDFYSLQKGEPAESELKSKKDHLWPNLKNCTGLLDDFSDTAALIENLDLVISVDTSTAHLAGALGKPVWILNRYDSCWRWLRGRSDTPWYPSARIYQQTSPGDWRGVIMEVKKDLLALQSNEKI